MAFGVHNRLFLERICERIPGAEYTLYFVQEELAAFNLLVVRQEAMVDKYFCMDYELGHKYNLYVLSWLENVRYCVERKIPLYHAGQGAENQSASGRDVYPEPYSVQASPAGDRPFSYRALGGDRADPQYLGFWPAAAPSPPRMYGPRATGAHPYSPP